MRSTSNAGPIANATIAARTPDQYDADGSRECTRNAHAAFSSVGIDERRAQADDDPVAEDDRNPEDDRPRRPQLCESAIPRHESHADDRDPQRRGNRDRRLLHAAARERRQHEIGRGARNAIASGDERGEAPADSARSPPLARTARAPRASASSNPQT